MQGGREQMHRCLWSKAPATQARTERGRQERSGDLVPLTSPGSWMQIWNRGTANRPLGGEWREGVQGDFQEGFKDSIRDSSEQGKGGCTGV